MKPKLILFDLFGTLVFSATKLKQEDYLAFYRKLGIQLRTADEVKNFTHLFSQFMVLAADWREISQKLLEKTIGGKDQKKIELLTNFLKANVAYQLFDDVKGVINLPYKKAILTSASRFLFSNLGLGKYFEIFTPKETKFLKPDPRAFFVPLEKFKVKPEETIMIGDEIERDLMPAKNLGMETILIDRNNKFSDFKGIKIHSLNEIKDVLGH